MDVNNKTDKHSLTQANRHILNLGDEQKWKSNTVNSAEGKSTET